MWTSGGNSAACTSAFTAPTRINGDRSAIGDCACGAPRELSHPEAAPRGTCVSAAQTLARQLPQVDLRAYVAALTAERHFRNHLAARGVLFDSFAMELGRACANPVFIGTYEIERRRKQTGIDNVSALVYPEQVKFARMLTSPMFLDYVTDPAREAHDRRARIALEVTKIFLH